MRLAPVNSASSAVLLLPVLAVRLIVGKNAARAAPMWACWAIKACSAACTSGRASKTLEGSACGSAGQTAWAGACSQPAGGRASAASAAPTNSCSALRLRASWAVYRATSPRAVSTVPRFCASARPEVAPSWNMRRIKA